MKDTCGLCGEYMDTDDGKVWECLQGHRWEKPPPDAAEEWWQLPPKTGD